MNRKLHNKVREIRPNALMMLKRASLALRKVQDESLAQFGLTSAQMEVLAPVYFSNGLEHRKLVEWLGVTSPTLTNIVDGLVQRGLIERRSSREDARVKQFYITEEGEALFQKVGEGREEFFRQFTAGFSEEELILFASFLKRLALNCGDTFPYDEHFKPEDVHNAPNCIPGTTHLLEDEKSNISFPQDV